jgi:hypothetical protein
MTIDYVIRAALPDVTKCVGFSKMSDPKMLSNFADEVLRIHLLNQGPEGPTAIRGHSINEINDAYRELLHAGMVSQVDSLYVLTSHGKLRRARLIRQFERIRVRRQNRLDQVTIPVELPDRNGVVYLLHCGKRYKIGKTVNGKRRYGQLKLQLPEKADLVHEIRTNDIDYCERHWHRHFAEQRLNGEWFILNDDDISEFKKCESMIVRIAESSVQGCDKPAK